MARHAFDKDALRRVAGLTALATAHNDLIPALQRLWFRDGAVTGFNDEIAIRYPLDLKITGTLHYAMLDKALGSMNGDATYEVGETSLILRSGRTRVAVSLGDASDPLYEFPAGNPVAVYTLPKSKEASRFYKFFSIAMDIVGARAVTAEYTSPMLWNGGGGRLVAAATNGSALVQQAFRLDWDWPTAPQVFPHAFYEALLALATGDRADIPWTLKLYGNAAVIVFDDGVMLWGQRMPLRFKADYTGMLASVLEEEPDRFPIGEDFHQAAKAHAEIQRRVLPGTKNMTKRIVRLSVAPGKLLLRSAHSSIARRDEFPLPSYAGEVREMTLDPQKLEVVAESCRELGFSRHLLVGFGRRMHFLLSQRATSESDEDVGED